MDSYDYDVNQVIEANEIRRAKIAADLEKKKKKEEKERIRKEKEEKARIEAEEK